MKTTRKTPEVTRTIRLERVPTCQRPGKLVVTQDGTATAYLLTRLESQIGGEGFRLVKVESEATADGARTLTASERYNVLLNGSQSSCDCKWGIYGVNKKPCRHIAGLIKLKSEGKLS